MCGHFGIYGPTLSQDDMDMWKNGILATQIRGLDGAGTFKAFDNPKDNRIDKTVVNMGKLMNDLQITCHKINGAHLMMGHCRSATAGAVNLDNAHPFDTGKYVSAHNGTLTDEKYWDIAKTDSQMMFEDIEVNGINKVLERLAWESAQAVVLYEKETQRLFLSRNSQRTLFLAFTTGGNIVYGSEIEIIEYAAKRAKVVISEVYRVDPDTTMMFDLKTMAPGRNLAENITKHDLTVTPNDSYWGNYKKAEYQDKEYEKNQKAKKKAMKGKGMGEKFWLNDREYMIVGTDYCVSTGNTKSNSGFTDSSAVI